MSNEQPAGAWLDTAKPARYTPHDERNAIELDKAFIADRIRFAGPAEPPVLAREETSRADVPARDDLRLVEPSRFSSEAST